MLIFFFSQDTIFALRTEFLSPHVSLLQYPIKPNSILEIVFFFSLFLLACLLLGHQLREESAANRVSSSDYQSSIMVC